MSANHSEYSLSRAYEFFCKHEWSFTAEQLLSQRPESGYAIAPRSESRPNINCLRDIVIYPGAGLLLTSQNEILGESTIYPALKLTTLDGGTFKPSTVVETPTMLLDGVYCDYFWHWLLEYLPRALVAEEEGFSGSYLLGGRAPAFVRESLELLGINSSRLQQAPQVPILCRNLWVVEPYTGTSGHGRAALEHFPDLVLSLREQLLTAARSPGDRSRRLYLCRKGEARGRNIVNENSLQAFLPEFGIDAVSFNNMSLKAQIGLTSTADLLIGPHGAAMLHTLFQPRGATVLEVVNSDFKPTTNHFIHRILGHRYFSFEGRRVDGDERHPNLADIWVDEVELYRCLQNLVGSE